VLQKRSIVKTINVEAARNEIAKEIPEDPESQLALGLLWRVILLECRYRLMPAILRKGMELQGPVNH
jgi:hypothetical protein